MLRMVKHSINAAQNVMGYRQHIEASHSNYMMMDMAQQLSKSDGGVSERRLSGVVDALKKDQNE